MKEKIYRKNWWNFLSASFVLECVPFGGFQLKKDEYRPEVEGTGIFNDKNKAFFVLDNSDILR